MLACERHGSGEPLVLIHGLTHRRQAWYPVLDDLAVHREVILVDLPGHGQSPDLVTHGRPVPDVLRDIREQIPLSARGAQRSQDRQLPSIGFEMRDSVTSTRSRPA